MSVTIDTVDTTVCPRTSSERVWTPAQLGRNGNPPPFNYQRRIDYLGDCPNRGPRFRADLLEAAGEAVGNSEILDSDLAVLHVIAERSNAHGKDVEPPFTLSETEIGRRVRKRNGKHYSARWASDALDRLREQGFIDWEHGQEAQRYDEARRQRLDGRWQGPCTYRLLIPARYSDAQAARRRGKATDTRKRHSAGRPGRVTAPKGTEPYHPDKRAQARTAGANTAMAGSVSTFEDGVSELEAMWSGELYEVAYDEFVSVWRRSRDGP